MDFLTVERYVDLLAAELDAVAAPPGPTRRLGVVDHMPSALDLVRRDLHAAAAELSFGKEAGKLSFATDLARETASYLYAAGAEHRCWRRWAALTAFGHAINDQILAACPYAILGGEWCLLESMSPLTPESGPPSAIALWRLAINATATDDLPDSDIVDQSWRTLLTAIPSGERTAIDQALGNIAEFWIAESEGDWEFYHPRSAPDFDPEPCAAAALARRYGWSPVSMAREVIRYLEPGLANGFPGELYPRLPALPCFESDRDGD
ncbi:hypothetical protein [Micromonospora sp. CA-111912]|uniref:hypothetical protein n=1 Tax=Micromonospora sp. CA-111912 TaxID=3239955 RepID=UPI003D91C723